MRPLKKELRDIRPALSLVAPVTFKLIVGFSVFNILLAISYPFVLATVPELHRVGFIDIRFWAVLFGIYGMGLAVNLVYNNWQHLKKLLVVGLFIKTIWLIQLISIAIITDSGFVIFSVFIWTLILYYKIVAYEDFTPSRNVKARNG